MRPLYRGVTLVELIVALTILMTLFSICLISVSKYDSDSRVLQEEADTLAMWFSGIMTMANREGRSVKIYLSQTPSGDMEIRAVAAGEDVASAKLVYRSSRVFIRNESPSVTTLSYDGVWQTLTPALTLSVRSKTNRAKKIIMTVSVYGLITIK